MLTLLPSRLSGNGLFFKSGDWRTPIVEMKHHSRLSEENRAMFATLLEVPQLLIEVNDAKRDDWWNVSFVMKHLLLGRADSLRNALRAGLIASNLQSYTSGKGSPACDKLGVCLAALVALDGIIEDLRPVKPKNHSTIEDETNELCTQLLQLELGAADAYPYTNVMSAFHWSNFGKEGSFVIVLPGRGEDQDAWS